MKCENPQSGSVERGRTLVLLWTNARCGECHPCLNAKLEGLEDEVVELENQLTDRLSQIKALRARMVPA